MEENKKTENSKAFPRHGVDQYGMTLRDYFANSAMQGICVNSGRNEFSFDNVDRIAYVAYKLADAMLKQREL